ncbi:MaoC family dehydratase [Sphingomonas sp. 37zxx]|uniref:MaoC family dehydratase n=1 Tax=Sphingomonas sp. 37zxx TaxID=1550073 RepID=UPI00053BEEA0|nr:MaoC family dehydratase [Sphingomonas sp. 37zxx]
MRYFEDLTIGDKAAFGSHVVTREEVLAFAARFDPQPFHLSDEAAALTHFGRMSASGWHSCAMTMAMFVTHLQEHPQASLGAAGVDELRWLKPVYPGDTLRCENEIIETRASRSRPEMGSTRSRMTTFNQHDEPVLSFIAIGLIATRPTPTA